MTDTLRNKLIQKGWVTEFHADTLVSLIEKHYAALAKPEPSEEVVVIELSSDLFNDDIPDLESMSASTLAVLDAYMIGFGWLDSPTKKDCQGVAAALRVAANHLPDPQMSAHMLYAIADELDPCGEMK